MELRTGRDGAGSWDHYAMRARCHGAFTTFEFRICVSKMFFFIRGSQSLRSMQPAPSSVVAKAL